MACVGSPVAHFICLQLMCRLLWVNLFHIFKYSVKPQCSFGVNGSLCMRVNISVPAEHIMCSKVTRSLINIYGTLIQWCTSTGKDCYSALPTVQTHMRSRTSQRWLRGYVLAFLRERVCLLVLHIQGRAWVTAGQAGTRDAVCLHRPPSLLTPPMVVVRAVLCCCF